MIPNKLHSKLKTDGIVATATNIKPMRKYKKLLFPDSMKEDSFTNQTDLEEPIDSPPICGKIILKKIQTKFKKKKKNDETHLLSQQSVID